MVNVGATTITVTVIPGANSPPTPTPDIVDYQLGAQLIPDNEFLVNTFINNFQYGAVSSLLLGGRSVVIWNTSDAATGDPDGGIAGQIYDSIGQPVGTEFLVNTTTLDIQNVSGVSSLEDGGFVVVWHSNTLVGNSQIVGQRFDINGSPIGNEFPAGSNVSTYAHVAALKDGGFVITYQRTIFVNNGSFTVPKYDVVGTVYNANGDSIGGFQANNEATKPDRFTVNPTVLSTSDGGFIIAWNLDDGLSFNNQSGGTAIRKYNANGQALSEPIQLVTEQGNNQWNTSINILENDNIVLAWNTSTFGSVSGQIFDVNGARIGREKIFISGLSKIITSIVSMKDGGFVILWDDPDTSTGDNSSTGIVAQRFQANGLPIGSILFVNQFTQNYQRNANAISLSDGRLFVVWESGDPATGDGSSSGISGLFYTLGALPNADTMIVDVLVNDTDPDADFGDIPSTFTLDSVSVQGAKGSASIINNYLLFDPGTDFAALTPGDTDVVNIDYTMSDDEGASSPSLVTINITYNSLPQVMITAPANGTNVVQGTSITFTGTANDTEDGDLGALIEWTSNKDGVLGTGTSASINISTLSPDTHTITASVTDSGGLVGTNSITVIVTSVNNAPVGLPVITGTASQGQTLTADASGISDLDGLGMFAYQWQGSGTDIAGATSSTYVLTQSEVGQTITVIVSYTDVGGTLENVPSAATAVVTDTNDAPVGLPLIMGTASLGQILTADTSGISDADGLGAGGFSYQWQSDDTDIVGATSSMYTLTQTEVGKVIKVVVSYVDGLGTLENVPSAGTAQVNTNTAPVINDNSVSVAEDIAINTFVYDVDDANTSNDTDQDGDALTYSLINSDGFNITATTGVITTDINVDLDYEAVTQYVLTVQADDGNGLQDTAQITIDVTAVNDNTPVITSLNTASVAENTTAVLTVTATDADLPGDTLSYSLSSGVDQALFTIDLNNGTLSFITAPDFENPTDNNTDNIYNVDVSVSDGLNATTQSVAVTVTDVNESSNTVPTVIITAPVDGTSVVDGTSINFTGTASDAEDAGLDGSSIQWSSDIDGSIGSSSSINVSALSVNTHVITASVTDSGSLVGTSSISVMVTSGGGSVTTLDVPVSSSSDDAEESIASGSVYLDSNDLEMIDNFGTLQVVGMRFTGITVPAGATITNAYIQFQADEVDTGSASLLVRGEAVDNAQAYTTTNSDISGRAQTTASVAWIPASWNAVGDVGVAQQTPDLAAVIQEIVNRSGWSSGNALALVVTGSGKRVAESYEGAAAPLLHLEYSTGGGSNTAPAINDNSVSVAEDITANSFVDDVDDVSGGDTDSDGDALTYSILGGNTGNAFSIDTTTGVITTTTPTTLDYEITTQYVLTVQADDGNGLQDTAQITIDVTAVNDNTPVITSLNTASVAENTTAVLTVTATDADLPGDTLSYSLSSGVDQALFTIDLNNGTLSFITAPDFENPTDNNTDNIYNVDVSVSDGLNATTQSVAVTVTDVNESSNTVPTVIITAPVDGTSVVDGTSINFTGTASDAEDAGLDGSSIQWSSDIDGSIGSSSSINVSALSVNTHVITASVTDSGSLVGTSSISVMVTSGGGSVTTLDVPVSSSSDDAEESIASGSVYLDSNDLEMIDNFGTLQVVGMRFTGITVPAGATITNAYIQFQADEVDTGSASLLVRGEAVDNAQAYTTTNSDISGRAQTTASVAWIPASWNAVGDVGVAQQTPDLAAVIQEIVNRSGWSSGNALALVVTGSGKRVAESYEGAAAPLLHVEYQ